MPESEFWNPETSAGVDQWRQEAPTDNIRVILSFWGNKIKYIFPL